jgi:hypothetical protein
MPIARVQSALVYVDVALNIRGSSMTMLLSWHQSSKKSRTCTCDFNVAKSSAYSRQQRG